MIAHVYHRNKIKYVGINLTNVQKLYEEKFKTLTKDTKVKLERRPCFQMEQLNIIRMSVLPKLVYKFSKITVKISTNYFIELGKWILKFTLKM